MTAGSFDSMTSTSISNVGLWPALSDALLMFPLTKSLRLSLLNLLCSQQVSCLMFWLVQSGQAYRKRPACLCLHSLLTVHACWLTSESAYLVSKYRLRFQWSALHEPCFGVQGMAPARAQGPPLITAAPVMGIILGLLRGCDEAEERVATLTSLKRLIGMCVMCSMRFASCSSNVQAGTAAVSDCTELI